jgi:hypothetical protein
MTEPSLRGGTWSVAVWGKTEAALKAIELIRAGRSFRAHPLPEDFDLEAPDGLTPWNFEVEV